MQNLKSRISTMALALGMLLSPSLQAEEYNLNLNLLCQGSGSATKSETTYINQYDPKTRKYSRTTAQTSSKQPFDGIVVVELSDGQGRIKLPDPMVPPLNTRDNGWFTIRNLVVNTNEITGTVKVNFLDNKHLRIDRRSGLLIIDGGDSSFSGKCSAVNQNTPRQF
ncbi:MAG: hypothetical protein HGA72_00520 [Chlorobiaceae bacterium]|nr:hypothetical protein [Chlorobiaceae bacterium]NTW64403.1 hypothetical protein [Chlorobiaceae bacterium]